MDNKLQLSLDLPMSEAVRLILLFQLDQLSQAAQAICSEEEPCSVDGVHDLRVAVRRSLTALDHFAPWLDPDWRKRYGKGFRPLLKRAGLLRDLDVLVMNMEAESAAGQTVEQAWLDKARKKQVRLRSEFSRYTGSKSNLKWLSEKAAMLNQDDAGLRMGKPPIGKRGQVQMHCMSDSLPVLLAQSAAGLAVYHQAMPQPRTSLLQRCLNADDLAGWSDYSQEVLHQLRLSAKQFRYCLEFAMAVPGFEDKEMLDNLKIIVQIEITLNNGEINFFHQISFVLNINKPF